VKQYIKYSVRIIFWALFIAVLGFILIRGIVLDGKIEYIYDFSKPNFYISELKPEDRVESVECTVRAGFQRECSQRITGDPVYFSVKPSRRFEKAVVSVKFRMPESQTVKQPNVIELGILKDNLLKRYELKPLDNRILDSISSEWKTLRQGDTILLQREMAYPDINSFLDNLPDPREIAAYNFVLKPRYLLAGYGPGNGNHAIPYHLRGAFQIYTYIKDENLDFNFEFSDLNRDTVHEKIDITVYYLDEPIFSRRIDGDINDTDNGAVSDLGKTEIKIPGLPEGAYKLEIRTNDDIMTRKLATKQNKFVFSDKLWFSGSAENPRPGGAGKIYTDSKIIHFNTTNPASLQTISVNGSELRISQTYKQYSFENHSALAEVAFSSPDFILAGNGMFAFNTEEFFDPRVGKVDDFFDPAETNINYIIADYAYPQSDAGWKYSSVEFDLSSAYSEEGRYGFIISIPGLRADDDKQDYLEISSIKINLQGKSIWQFLGSKIKR